MGLNVIMMGPPGAGKGTQAARFARERGLLKISTGDILRDAIKEGSPVALAAKSRMDRGELVEGLVRRRASRRICANCGAGADPYGGGQTCKPCGGRLVQRTDDNKD